MRGGIKSRKETWRDDNRNKKSEKKNRGANQQRRNNRSGIEDGEWKMEDILDI